MGNMTDRPHGLETLRYVRLMLLVVPLLLIVAILIYAVVNHRIEDSISSYYLGPARDLFVAMVVATGILLVVYSGAPMEDLALNLAGFYAMFVALVPTRFEASLDLLDEAGRSRAVLSVRVAIIAVLIVTAAILWLMGAGLAAWPVLVWLGVRQAVFIVEWFQIGLFAYFWYLESRRLWEH